MSLHTILSNRKAVNTLKILYQNEVVEKKSHTMCLKEVEKQLETEIPEETIKILNTSDLIRTDKGEQDTILSTSQKGKEFIEIFDQLVELYKGKKEKATNSNIKYGLTEIEKKIIVMITRMASEIGKENVTLKNLTRELFPTEPYESKSKTISRQIKRLEEINLVERSRKGRETTIRITETGERTIKDQFLMGIIR